MLKTLKVLTIIVMVAGVLMVCGATTYAGSRNPTTAIDVALEPDSTMIRRAETVNAHLRMSYPKGFALGKTHHPHISCLQRYVRTADLDNVYVTIGKILNEEKPAAWKLKAFKYYYIPWKDLGLAGIVVEPTDNLLRLQQKLIDAIAPYTEKIGTAKAFVTTAKKPEINQPTIDYVASYVPEYSGKNFNPHVTAGIDTQTVLKKMLAEPFEEFTFSPVGVSVYQLGNYGTARKKLKGWELKP